jgi:hypothetical protein
MALVMLCFDVDGFSWLQSWIVTGLQVLDPNSFLMMIYEVSEYCVAHLLAEFIDVVTKNPYAHGSLAFERK